MVLTRIGQDDRSPERTRELVSEVFRVCAEGDLYCDQVDEAMEVCEASSKEDEN